ncbi:hypothetical protein JCM10213_003110 [Rhodosporidiobolus nylandii]
MAPHTLALLPTLSVLPTFRRSPAILAARARLVLCQPAVIKTACFNPTPRARYDPRSHAQNKEQAEGRPFEGFWQAYYSKYGQRGVTALTWVAVTVCLWRLHTSINLLADYKVEREAADADMERRMTAIEVNIAQVADLQKTILPELARQIALLHTEFEEMEKRQEREKSQKREKREGVGRLV